MLSLSLTLSLIIILSFHLLFNPFHGSICLIHPIISSHLIIILCILEITQRLVGKPSEEIETVIIETGIQRTIHTLNYVNPYAALGQFLAKPSKPSPLASHHTDSPTLCKSVPSSLPPFSYRCINN